MASPAPLVVGIGAATPLGRTLWASAAAVRAGLCGFREHPFMVDSTGEPMRAALAPWLPADLGPAERLAELVLPAVAQALEPLAPALARPGERPRIGLALGLPPSRPGLTEDPSGYLRARLMASCGGIFEGIASFPIGHSAGLYALDAALKGLASGRFDACLIAGTDSYAAPETLEWLEASDQLHGAGRLNNAWGLVPGEGAGAVTLASPALAARERLAPLGRVLGIGLASETNRIKTDSVCIGEGLTAAFRAALERVPPGRAIDNMYCDLNGEAYRADEYGFAALRTREGLAAASDFIAPADCWGDVGAAGAPLHLGLAAIAHAKGYSKGPLTLIWASSESGERAAALFEGQGAD